MTVADETVTLPPDALIVPDNEAVFPTMTFPKANELGLTFSCGGAMPVPDSVTAGELEALLTNVILPEVLPVTVGANTTE